MLAAVVGFLSTGCEPKAKLTIRTVDDLGNPVIGAEVRVHFEHNYNPNNRTTVSGHSNDEGKFGSTRRTSGDVVYGADKDGYYGSRGIWKAGQESETGEWQPWNPTIDLVMRPVLNPVPLVVRETELVTIDLVGAAAFDLVGEDWLPPYGDGVTPDFVFNWTGEFFAPTNRQGEMIYRGIESKSALDFSFSNDGDGLIIWTNFVNMGSDLRLPNLAPENGYARVRSWQRESNPTWRSLGPDPSIDTAFFFRVRTRTNELGEVVSALYGKTERDLEFTGGSAVGTRIAFTYYLNPALNDRNLEYDGKTNLFNLPKSRAKQLVPEKK